MPPPLPSPQAPLAAAPPPAAEFSLPSGLRIRRVTPGTGPRARYGQRVLIHYVVRAAADGRVIDDTVARQAPQPLRIGEPGPFPGLSEGIRGMLLGEERALSVPAHLAYPILRPGQADPQPEPLEVQVTLLRLLPTSPSEP